MHKRQFHNALRILFCAGRGDMGWMDDEQWGAFRRDPYAYCIQCSDAAYDNIWAMIESHQPKADGDLGALLDRAADICDRIGDGADDANPLDQDALQLAGDIRAMLGGAP